MKNSNLSKWLSCWLEICRVWRGSYVADHTADAACRCFRWVDRCSGKINCSKSTRSHRNETSNLWGGCGRWMYGILQWKMNWIDLKGLKCSRSFLRLQYYTYVDGLRTAASLNCRAKFLHCLFRLPNLEVWMCLACKSDRKWRGKNGRDILSCNLSTIQHI